MGFFDQLGKKASDTMQSAKEKTNKISTEMKLKSQLSDKKDRITVLYSEIGKEVYSNYNKGINENTEEIFIKLKEIADINKEVNVINEELLALKGVKICSSCRGQIPVGSEFCPKCGSKVVEVVNKATDTAVQIEVQVVKVKENEENNSNESDEKKGEE